MALYQKYAHGDSPCDYESHCSHCNDQQLDHELHILSIQDDVKKLLGHFFSDRKMNDIDLAWLMEDLASQVGINIKCFSPLKMETK